MPNKINLQLFNMAKKLLFLLLITGIGVWGSFAIFYSGLESVAIKWLLICIYSLVGITTIIAVLMRYQQRIAITSFSSLFILLLVWWVTIPASNDRQWLADVALLAYADIDGDNITVHNIRNFDYRTETAFTPHYYDKTFNLNKLKSVDLVAVYWMGPAIAHTFLSFGFADGEQLAISIETRKEKGEGYSTIKGFFKQYELYYVVADERDVIRLRTNYRKTPPEDVYLYRVNGAIENGRSVFLQYMHKLNTLKRQPEFYNTLLNNCTTGIWMNTRINPDHIPMSWKILLSGYLPEYLYDAGVLNNSISFNALQQLAHINARAHSADAAPDFSRQIRLGIPGMGAGSMRDIALDLQ